MNSTLGKIAKVEINGLWGRLDLVWDLDPTVNILSGINGSGKSTVLDCVSGLLHKGAIERQIAQTVKVTFDNGKFVSYEYIQDTIKNLEEKAKEDTKYKGIISDLKEREGDDYKRIKSISFGLASFDDLQISLEEMHQLVEIDIISTFDAPIPEYDRPNEQIRTELDRHISYLQVQYLDFQLNTNKKVFETIAKKHADTNERLLELNKQQNRFIEIVDELFRNTGKKINRDKNEVMFLLGEKEITPYQLSSGEKQILIILLTALVQDNKSAILFMDEPEISLHFDWQKKIIQYVLELNPNVQIILATHAPAVIMEGWHDKVSDMRDLITNNQLLDIVS